MPSPAPLQYGQTYHIHNRGNNCENIFVEERNRQHFLRLYTKYIEPTGDTYAYCLLRNLFHFLVRMKTEEEQEETYKAGEISSLTAGFKPKNPSQQFSNLFNAYAKAMNSAYERSGSLFHNLFGRVRVASEAHFVHLITYIQQNPQRLGLVDDFRNWHHSSYRTILSTKPTRLKRDDVLAWFHGLREFEASHRTEIRDQQVAPLVPDDPPTRS